MSASDSRDSKSERCLSERDCAGRQLGRYRLEQRLGTGGMGEVFLATDESLGRKVAVKVLPSHVAEDPSRVARFVVEARTVAALNHPHILTIYEIGSEGHIHFIVTELIEGQTLRQRLISGPPPTLGETVEWMLQAASALSAAHAAKIVHRDIKPENIVIRHDNYLKILDFGLAKRAPPDRESTENVEHKTALHTAPGIILGTIPYMSPEQARGQKVDVRSDIWSIGCVMYEMLTGHQAFSGRTPSDVLAAILAQPLPRLGTQFRQFDALQQIVDRAMARELPDRYQTIDQFADDLRALHRRLQQDSGLRQSMMWVETATRVDMAGSFGEANLMRFAARDSSRPSSRTSLAVLPLVNVSGNPDLEYLADGVAENLINHLSRLEPLRVIARSTAFQFRDSAHDPVAAGRQLQVEKVIGGRIQQRGDELSLGFELVTVADGSQHWGRTYRRQLNELMAVEEEIALEIARQLNVETASPQPVLRTTKQEIDPEAYQSYLRSRHFWYKSTPEDYQKSREFAQKAIDADPASAMGFVMLSHFWGFGSALGMFEPSYGWPRSEAAVLRALELDDSVPESYNALAGVQMQYHRDWPAAEQSLTRAIELNKNFAEPHHQFSFYLNALGRHDEALAAIQRALKLDPLSVRFQWSEGRVLLHAGRYADAIVAFRRGLQIEPNDPWLHEWLGWALYLSDLKRDAIGAWRRHFEAMGQAELASLLSSSSDPESALQAVSQRQLEQYAARRREGDYVPAMFDVYAHVALGAQQQALEWFDRSCEEHNVYNLYARVDPRLDPLRSNPSFCDALERIKPIGAAP